MKTSVRARRIRFSATLALDLRAKALQRSGVDVVNMAVGEPDFPAPDAVRAAAVAKVQSGDVRYTPAPGALEVREAVARHLSTTRGVPFEAAEVVVGHSAKHALANALLALVDPSDEVLVPLPAWVSYVELVRLAEGEPVSVPGLAAGGLDLERLEAAVTPRTRGILVNSPCNPSGYVMTRAETEALAAFAERHDLWILSDEIYRRLVFDGEPAVSPVQVSPATRARTIVVDGASKSLAMTGYRIGFLAAPVELAEVVTALQSQMTGAPNSVSQAAYAAGLEPEPAEVAAMVEEFRRRRDLVARALSDLGLEAPLPRGAFYVFPDVAGFLDERGSAGFCEDLLESEALALVPGSAFGADGHVRLSYAMSEERLNEAMQRLARFLEARGSQTR